MFDRVVKALFGTTSDEADGEAANKRASKTTKKSQADRVRESDILTDPELLGEKVDIERRVSIITTHYDDVSREDAEVIAETLKTYTETYDLDRREAKQNVCDEISLERERAERIWWTERHSVQMLNSLDEDLDVDLTMEYSWSTAGDEQVHPVCEEVAEEIENRAGSVPLEELQEILREKAEKYENQGGTPERVDHLVAHEKCRSAILSHPK